MIKASLILPSYNRAELLDLGLLSIWHQSIFFNLEIIVLNDGKPDDTESVCKKYSDKLNIRYIFTGQRNLKGQIKKRNPGFVLNIGIKQATSDIIIQSSPEVFHLDDNINTLLNCLQGNKNVLATLNRILFDNQGELTKHLLETSSKDFFRIKQSDISPLRHDNHSTESAKMPYFMGFYKKWFMDIGGYDEDFTGLWCEDNDLMRRFYLKGLRYRHLDGRVVHLYHGKKNTGRERWDNVRWVFNYKLLQKRKEIMLRNVGKEWGVLDA